MYRNTTEFRLLDALLTHAPTEEGVSVIATDIVTASTEQNSFQQLAEFYKAGLLLPSKSACEEFWRLARGEL
jgi:hypothetical protein